MNSFHTAALAAAKRHNLLSEADRAEFEACLKTDELDGWALLVMHDLSARCRSFRPAVLDELAALAQKHGAIP